MNSFLNNYYEIPNYQREYSWEEDELKDFWQDLEDTFRWNLNHPSDKKKHFFGQIVIHEDASVGKKYIVDGQQRTITSTLFLKALASVAKNVSTIPSGLADMTRTSILSSAIGFYDAIHNINKVHLNLGSQDNEYFLQNIICLDDPDKCATQNARKSQLRLCYAYRYMFDHIQNFLNGFQDKEVGVDELYTTFGENFEIISIGSDTLDDAYDIFETLNARGKDLLPMDLIKNHIFTKVSSDKATVQKQWEAMLTNLKTMDTSDFLKAYWNSHNEFVRDKKLYKTISSKVNDEYACRKLLDDLEKYSSYFYDICNPEDASTIDDDDLLSTLRNLKTLKAKIFYSVALSMQKVAISSLKANITFTRDGNTVSVYNSETTLIGTLIYR
ncbi:MAG: DUF262 domain-containing protein [Spirochaetales bacterium]|nr:DUF262 domain-containing protein [Candidatus Physcosoma equi]